MHMSLYLTLIFKIREDIKKNILIRNGSLLLISFTNIPKLHKCQSLHLFLHLLFLQNSSSQNKNYRAEKKNRKSNSVEARLDIKPLQMLND